MALTRLQQGQISGTLGDNVSDSVTNANLLKANRTLEDDLNSLRSQIKRIQGTAAWTEELSGSQDLSDIYAAMHVDGSGVEFQGALFVSGAAEVSGTLRVISNAISGSDGLNMTLGASGHVEVEGKLQVSGDEVEAASGNTVLRFANDDVYVPNDMFVSGALEVSGAVDFLGDLSVGGDLTVMGDHISGSQGLNLTLGAAGAVTVDGVLQVDGDDIKSSAGNVAIHFNDEDVVVKGDLTVEGGKVTLSNGAVIDSETAGEMKLDEDLVKMTGDLEVQGGKITMSNGAIIDSETAGEMKLDEDLVKMTGDLEVQGGNITLSNGSTINSETAGELKLTEDLVSVNGNLTVTGDLIVQGSTTVVETENLLVKDAIVGFGYASGSVEEADGDRGFIFSLNGDNTTMFWDDSADEFKFAFTASTPATGTIVTTSYADLRAGVVTAEAGFSGSLTKLVDGSDYLIADVGVSITVNENGSITIGGASDSYAKGYFDVGDVVADEIDFSASLGELSEAVDKNVDVYLNGVLLRSGAGFDVVSISSTSVTLNSAIAADLQAEDVITIVVRGLLPPA